MKLKCLGPSRAELGAEKGKEGLTENKLSGFHGPHHALCVQWKPEGSLASPGRKTKLPDWPREMGFRVTQRSPIHIYSTYLMAMNMSFGICVN